MDSSSSTVAAINERNFSKIACILRSRTLGSFVTNQDGFSWTPLGKNPEVLKIPGSSLQSALWIRANANRGSLGLKYKVVNKGKDSKMEIVEDGIMKKEEDALLAGEEEDKHDGDIEYDRFDNFDVNDLPALKEICNFFGVQIEHVEMNPQGLGVGELVLNEELGSLELIRDGKAVLSVPLKSIAQCAAPAKNELEIQFAPEDSMNPDDEQLIEMRLFIPEAEDYESGDEDGLEESKGVAAQWQERIISKSGSKQVTGNLIVNLPDSIGQFMVPRGRYNIEFYEKFFRMSGKTYDYKINYKSIRAMFLLPKSDDKHQWLVISLLDSIRQGQQSYPHLVFQVENEHLPNPIRFASDVLFQQLKLQERGLDFEMEGPAPNQVAKIFKALSEKKVFLPGSFESKRKSKCIKCALKANDGSLYPLAKSFFFLPKPALFIPYQDIDHVSFDRVLETSGAGDSTRNFDFTVVMKSDGNGNQPVEHKFSAIQKEEFDGFLQFLEKRVAVKNLAKFVALRTGGGGRGRGGAHLDDGAGDLGGEDDDDEDSPDSDFGTEEDDDDDDGSDSDSGETSDDDAELVDEDFLGTKKMNTDGDGEEKKNRKKKNKSLSNEVKQKSSSGEGKASSSSKKQGRDEKDDNNGGSPKKKTKREVDPNAPKRPINAYQLFSKAYREELKNQPGNETLKQPEFMSKIADAWKALSEEEKSKYNEEANVDKERYKTEMASYVPTPGFEKKPKEKKPSATKKGKVAGDTAGGEDGGKKKKKKDANAPKRNLTAFMFYSQAKAAELKDMKLPFAERSKKLGDMWKAASEEEKKFYEEQAAADKARYQEQMKTYVPPADSSESESSSSSSSSSGSDEDSEDGSGSSSSGDDSDSNEEGDE